ncbi:unnamed protein product [Malus baccata var. baccata]
MAMDNRTLKVLSASGLDNAAPLCIQYPTAAQGKTEEFKLKSSLLHHIPKFHGLSMEDPNKHLKEFEVVCSSMTPVNVNESILKMKAVPFSLMDKAKDWLYELAPGTVTSWESMKRAFLQKFFPTSRIILLRKKISGIQQEEGESFPTYYERFKSLVASCPQHQMAKGMKIQGPMVCGVCSIQGHASEKCPQLIENGGWESANAIGFQSQNQPRNDPYSNTYNPDWRDHPNFKWREPQQSQPQGGFRQQPPGFYTKPYAPPQVQPQSAPNASGFRDKIQSFLVEVGKGLNEGFLNEVGFLINVGVLIEDGFLDIRPLNPCPLLSRGCDFQPINTTLCRTIHSPSSTIIYYTIHPHCAVSFARRRRKKSGAVLAIQGGWIVGAFLVNFHIKNQNKRVDHLEKQIGQIADFVGKFRDQGQLPSSTIPNPKRGFESAKSILLRSGKEVGAGSKPSTSGLKEDEKLNFEEEEEGPPTAKVDTPMPQASMAPNLSNSSNKGKNVSNSIPSRFMQTKKEEAEKDILETLRKVQVNIPLLDAIKQVPRYAKFLKELCTTRKRISTKEVVKVGENVSAILQRKLPPKCKDPGSFTIPCVIGNTRFKSAMLDLGASINVMPYSIYVSMNLGELKHDGVTIQLADRSNAYPKGVLEDVLVQVDHLIFPADFYVLEMDESDHALSLPILLGRPFMKTAQTKIDVYNRTLSMEFDGENVNFNLSDSIKYPSEDHSCFSIDIIDSLAQGYLEDLNDDALEKVITRGMELKTKGVDSMLAHGIHEPFHTVPPSEEIIELVAALESLPKHGGKSPNFDSIPISTNKLLPSIIQAPIIDLKPLPSHLKYIFLGETRPYLPLSPHPSRHKKKRN